jgi:hypothetical protein
MNPPHSHGSRGPQIYLLDRNPLLRKPLTLAHVKTKLLGHFGTTPGQVRICHVVPFIIVDLFPLLRRDLSSYTLAMP